jgi:hypothetical protein
MTTRRLSVVARRIISRCHLTSHGALIYSRGDRAFLYMIVGWVPGRYGLRLGGETAAKLRLARISVGS